MISEANSAAFLKFVMLEDHRSEYNFQLHCVPEGISYRIEYGDVKKRTIKTIWSSDLRSDYLNKWMKVAIRLYDQQISWSVDDVLIHQRFDCRNGKTLRLSGLDELCGSASKCATLYIRRNRHE